MDDELQDLRKRKLEELRRRQEQNADEQQHAEQQIAQLEAVAKNLMTREAIQRYSNLKIAHQEKSVQLLVVLAQLVQQGRIKSKITDEQLKQILVKLTPEKHNIKITRK